MPPLGLDEPKIAQLTAEEQALFSRPEKAGIDPSSIGALLAETSAEGYPLVQRPDGRIRRYFTVEGIKEQRRSLRRDAALPSITLLNEGELGGAGRRGDQQERRPDREHPAGVRYRR
ncbi:MAG: hypothetical protein HND48_02185 [Chloroflexi bacterium]|nr:hypothetical protein [Chloroflexota bacterium]